MAPKSNGLEGQFWGHYYSPVWGVCGNTIFEKVANCMGVGSKHKDEDPLGEEYWIS